MIIKGLHDLGQSDLIEMQKFSRENKGYRYILCVINCLSKYAYAEPLTDKRGVTVTKAMEKILEHCKLDNLQTDMGSEYLNASFKNLMKRKNINHYTSFSPLKCSICERFIRTLKSHIYRHFLANGTHDWVSVLPKLLSEYNARKHSSTGFAPKEVKNKHVKTILARLKSQWPKTSRKVFFKRGDFVRISKYKSVFSKSYLPSWTTEIFKVMKVVRSIPPVYLLADLKGNQIRGAFYREELARTKFKDDYLIEKVIKRDGDRVLVQWYGFPASEQSWINKKDFK